MNRQLFIPDKIKVGFCSRDDTYTKRLAYIIYYDQKGVLRKEKSWQAWRDGKIDPADFANEPTEGFVLNKGVGGARRSYGWNVRNEYIRVYDPRDFEFEISIANLLFILRECDCSKGKGLEGKFVYAWDGTELVLLPTIAEDYQQCRKYTELQGQGVKAKEMIPGAAYTTKKLQTLTYLGRFNYHTLIAKNGYPKRELAVTKQHIFWDGKWFVVIKDLKQIGALQSDAVTPEYAELVDRFYKSANGSKVVRLCLKDAPTHKPQPHHYGWGEEWVYEETPGVFVDCMTKYDYRNRSQIDYVQIRGRVTLKDNAVHVDDYHGTAYPPKSPRDLWRGYGNQQMPWVEPTDKHLWALLESGQEYRYSYSGLIERTEPEDNHDGKEDNDD